MRRLHVPIRERRHRLARDAYRGQVAAVFHACLAGRRAAFADGRVVAAARDMLLEAAERNGCLVLAYCFMPDHVHVIMRGLGEESDLWKAMVRFKRMSGPWLRREVGVRWQKDFYDNVLVPEVVEKEIEYVLLNPVQEGLVRDWWDHPYSWRAV